MYDKFNKWFNKRYKTIIRLSYIIPILFVAGVSIAHVIAWYSMTNPSTWSIYLSIGIEIAALSALAGFAVKAKNNSVYLPFIIVTFIQFIGNIFYAFQFIDINGQLFKDWVTLVGPLFETIGMAEVNDIDSHRRWLSLFSGGLLPLISLSFLHLLVKFNDKEDDEQPVNDTPTSIDDIKPEIIENKVIEPTISYGVDDEELGQESIDDTDDTEDNDSIFDYISLEPKEDVKILDEIGEISITPPSIISEPTQDVPVIEPNVKIEPITKKVVSDSSLVYNTPATSNDADTRVLKIRKSSTSNNIERVDTKK